MANDFRSRGLDVARSIPDSLFFRSMGDGASDHRYRLIHIKGLRQIFVSPSLKAIDGALKVRVGGHDDDGYLMVHFLHALNKIEARGPGHADICDDGQGSLITIEVMEGLVCRVKGFDGNARLAERSV